jgi:hypothetical protein
VRVELPGVPVKIDGWEQVDNVDRYDWDTYWAAKELAA